MKKVILVLILVSGLGAGTYYWKNSGGEKRDEPTITLAKIERGTIKQIVATTGKVVSNLDVDIKCKASGTLIELPFDVSDSVKKGAMIVKLDPIDMDRMVKQAQVSLDASQARLASARENLSIAERNLKTDRDRAEASLRSTEVAATDARAKADRMKQLFEKKLASQEDCDTAETSATQALSALQGCKIKLEELETQKQGLEVQRQNVKLADTQVQADQVSLEIAQDRYKDTEVYAPMDGVVTVRPVQTGMIIASGVSNVGGGTAIMTLSDLSRIFVLASVDESDIGKVQVGQTATITADAYPTMQFQGKVVRIASKGVNLQNVVTFEVKIEILGAIKRSEKASASQMAVDADKIADADRAPATQAAAVADRGPAAQAGPRGERGPRGDRGDRGHRGPRGTRPVKAEAGEVVAELKSLLKPEMTTNIEITTAERQDALLIPVEAVSRLSGQFFANTPSADTAVDTPPEKKQIEIGITDGERYELVSGMAEGDTIAIRRGEADSKWANSGQQRRPGQQGGASMRVMRMGGGGR